MNKQPFDFNPPGTPGNWLYFSPDEARIVRALIPGPLCRDGVAFASGIPDGLTLRTLLYDLVQLRVLVLEGCAYRLDDGDAEAQAETLALLDAIDRYAAEAGRQS